MRLADVVAVSKAVAGSSARLTKTSKLADLIRRIPPDEVEIAIGFLSGAPRQGRMGIGAAALGGLRAVPAAETPSLDIREVDAAFDRIAAATGPGSAASRSQLLRRLF